MKDREWQQLRRERSARYWGRLLPDLRVAGNYLPGFFILGLVAMLLYDRLLKGLSPASWIWPVSALGLVAAFVPVRIRTYAEQADSVFLLPAEQQMIRVYRRALVSAWPSQMAGLVVTAVVVWPLFRIQGMMDKYAYMYVIAALLLLKTVNMLLWWQEQQLVAGRIRGLFAGLRFVAGYGAIAAGLWQGFAAALLTGGACYLLLVLGYRVPERHLLNWERLIRLEQRARKSWRRFIGQMTEGEQNREEARPNPLARLAERIRYGPEQAFRYLYLLVWLRSPLFGLCVRLVATGIVLAAFAGDVLLQAGIGALFAAALHLQLKELQRRDDVAEQAFLLPVPAPSRIASVVRLRLQLWLAGTVLLLLPAGIGLVM